MSAAQRLSIFLSRSHHWIMYRLRLRSPRFWARVECELPLRPATRVYTEVTPSGKLIPNVVYQTWTAPLFGRTHVKELERFRARNADYTFRFFSDADISAYMRAEFHQHPVYEVFQSARFGPLKTDIWRYCILYQRGGVYCDIGKSISIPLAQLIPEGATTVLSWEKRGVSPYKPSAAVSAQLQHPDKVNINWALMFAPGHPLLKRVIDGIVEKYPAYKGKLFETPKSEILRFTGPVHLTECVLAAIEAGELASAHQAGIEFHDTAHWGVPGSWVRYTERPPYELARSQPIVV